jgi:ABC-type polysaccharide/polyol phosphate transport system ATPase subunit
MDVAVRVKNITKIYKLYDDKWGPLKEIFTKKKFHKEYRALDNVSLDFPKGESIGVLGSNGSGKSTLLKIITGIAEPTSGTVEVNGSLVFLDVSSGIDGELSGYDNIFLKGTLLGYTKQEMMEKVDDIIEFSELGEYIYQPVKNYSSGMRSKLGFAISVNVDPDILIVDEALAVGDAKFRKKCMDKMNQFKEAGKTIIFVSHDKNAVESFCSRAAWINKGKLITYGDSKKVASYYNEFMSGKKTLEEILAEVHFNHSIEGCQYRYSETGLSFNLSGYLYGDNDSTNNDFELIIRDLRTNQLISKSIERVPFNKDRMLSDAIRKQAGFVINFDEEEFYPLYKPGKYVFEIRYRNENEEQCTFTLWAGNVEINQNNKESNVVGKYKHVFKVENNHLYLQIANHEKLQEQVNKIWFEEDKLFIEYVAFVRNYQTESPKDVDSYFILFNLDSFEEIKIPSIVSETEEITENPVFNPQGKLYNYSKFNVAINLEEIPKGRYECKINYKMNKQPFYNLLNLVWATKTKNYPAKSYFVRENKEVKIMVKSNYLYINVDE